MCEKLAALPLENQRIFLSFLLRRPSLVDQLFERMNRIGTGNPPFDDTTVWRRKEGNSEEERDEKRRTDLCSFSVNFGHKQSLRFSTKENQIKCFFHRVGGDVIGKDFSRTSRNVSYFLLCEVQGCWKISIETSWMQ